MLTVGVASASDSNITQEVSVSNLEIDNSAQDIAESHADEDVVGKCLDEAILSRQVASNESQIDGEKLQKDSSSKDDALGSSKCDIYVDVPKKFVLGRDYMTVNLPTGAKGAVTIYVDGKVFEKVSEKNFYRDWDFHPDYETGGEDWYECECSLTTVLLGLSAGKHTIKVVFSGDPKYGTSSKKVTINAKYLLTAEVKGPYFYGLGVNKDGSKIRINLPRDCKGKPVIKIDGKKFKSPKGVDGSFDLDISKLSAGTHTMKISYKEGKKYPSQTITKKFKVQYAIFSRFNSNIYSWQSTQAKYGDGSKFILKLPFKAKGKLSVYVSKKKSDKGTLYKSTKLKKGSASISLDGLKSGRYYAHVVYTGKDYKVKSLNCSFSIDINLIAPESMGYGENKYLVIKSYKSDNRQFKVYYDTDLHYANVKLVNGVGKVSLKKLPIFKGYIDVVSDDGSTSDDFKLEVLPLVGGKDIKMYCGDGKKYSIKVYYKNGTLVGKNKIVKFNIGGKTYNVKTNAKSIASLKITNKSGKYKITASYGNYKVSNKITVKHVLALKTVKVKKSAKKLVLTATLKKGKKALASQKVIFKFNDKKYAAKTNKKGVAKAVIKKSVLKKLKVGKKVKYLAIFKQDTIKKSAKVKK